MSQKNIKIKSNGNHSYYWETSGVYDLAEQKTQRQINASKLNKNQGSANQGKAMIVGSDGNLVPGIVGKDVGLYIGEDGGLCESDNDRT